ncbi:hypothetical protein [Meridianimarinicoccus sp. MJW13]|uniref:hypothetical protein n=1 Tax=Meridianimarinicoccus sp. MJW13 TaxID=2720031 RepID=UPI0018696134|nr:hypothetical protein [Fluviibacterium sp. MJW13]
MIDETVLRSQTDVSLGIFSFPTPRPANPPADVGADPHPGWLHQIRVLDIRLANTSEQSPKWSAAWSEREHLTHQMCRTSPSTWDGLVAQLAWINEEIAPVLSDATDTAYPTALECIRDAVETLRGRYTPKD